MSEPGGRRRERERSAAVGASLLLHAAALAALGWAVAPLRWATPPSPPEPVVQLHLGAAAGGGGALGVRRSGATETVSADRAHSAANSPTAAVPTAAAAPASTAAPARAPAAPATPSTAPGAASGSAPAAGPAGRAPGGADGSTAGVQAALRGLLGCAHAAAMDLTSAEKAGCAERLGLASRTAPRVDPIPAEKRAYYDAAAAAYASARAPPSNGQPRLNGDRPTNLLADKGGFMLPLAACSMRFGVPRGWKSYHDLPPHALKLAQLGPLKCFTLPPSGRGFEESTVEAAASLREQTDDAAHMKALDAPPPPR